VQAARESARRTQCVNNLKQIGMACHEYHDVHKRFPYGGVGGGNGDPFMTQTGGVSASFEPELHGWLYHILPFMEQEAAFERGWTNRTQLRRTIVNAYYCPTRRQIRLYRNLAKSDYAGNGGSRSGVNSDGVMVETLDMSIDPATNKLVEHRQQPKVSTAQILDGTSNTLLAAESRVHLAYMDIGQTGYNSDNEDCYTAGFNDDVVRRGGTFASGTVTPLPPEPDMYDPSLSGALCHNKFGSSHPGLLNVLLADGSVRNVRFTIAPRIFANLALRKDGAVIDVSGL
jgi:prepilin-type processing-associated H-X9-DG protein